MYISLFIAQTTGLFCFIFSIIMLSRAEHIKGVLLNLKPDSPSIFLYCINTLVASCCLLVVHNNWNSGSYFCAISLVGWVLFFKALVWLVATEEMIKLVHYCAQSSTFTLLSLITMVIGVIYLIIGFGPIIALKPL